MIFDREDRSGLRNYFLVVVSFQDDPVYTGKVKGWYKEGKYKEGKWKEKRIFISGYSCRNTKQGYLRDVQEREMKGKSYGRKWKKKGK